MIGNSNEKIEKLIDRIFFAIPAFNKTEAYQGYTITKIYEKMSSPKKDTPIIKSFCEYESAIDNLSSNKIASSSESKKSKDMSMPWKWNSSTFCQTKEYANLIDFKRTKAMIEDFSKYRDEQFKLNQMYKWEPTKVIIYGKIAEIDISEKIIYLKHCQTHISKENERFDFKMFFDDGVDSFEEHLGSFVVITCIDKSKTSEKRKFHENGILNEPIIIKIISL